MQVSKTKLLLPAALLGLGWAPRFASADVIISDLTQDPTTVSDSLDPDTAVKNGWILTAAPDVTVANLMAADKKTQSFTLTVPFGSINQIDTISLELPKANLGMSNNKQEFFNITLKAVNNTTDTWTDFGVFNFFDFNVARGNKVPDPINLGPNCVEHPEQAHIHPNVFHKSDNTFTQTSPATRFDNKNCGVLGMEAFGGGVVAPGATWSRELRIHDFVVPGDPQGTLFSFQLQPSIPEPSTLLLCGTGLLGIAGLILRRRLAGFGRPDR
jgi:hypothetical protein